MSAAAQKLLDRLHGVRQTAPERWLAPCPAHKDRSPSLSIRALDDGRALLFCFAGCETGDVLAAIGLELRDLFPDRLPEHRYRASNSKIAARDLLGIISEEVSVVAMIADSLLSKRDISDQDWQRLATAAARIHRARDHAHG